MNKKAVLSQGNRKMLQLFVVLPHFRDIAGFSAEKSNPTPLHPNFGELPLD